LDKTSPEKAISELTSNLCISQVKTQTRIVFAFESAELRLGEIITSRSQKMQSSHSVQLKEKKQLRKHWIILG